MERISYRKYTHETPHYSRLFADGQYFSENLLANNTCEVGTVRRSNLVVLILNKAVATTTAIILLDNTSTRVGYHFLFSK